MDSSAIDRIAQLAVKADNARRLDTTTPAIVLAAGNGEERVESLERFQAHRSRFRGTYATSSINDFAQYVIARPGAKGFIDTERMAAEVFFNLLETDPRLASSSGPADVITPDPAKIPGHADHVAVLKLQETAPFKAMLAATAEDDPRKGVKARVFSQKSIVEWIEDWSDYLAADYPDATDNQVNDPHRIRQALTALRKVKIKANAEAVHTDKDFGASRSALEDVEASSEVGLPRGFRFTCTSHDGLPVSVFYLRLGVRPDAEKPTFILRWPRRESDIEQLGQDFKKAILDAIGDKATLLLGTFDPGN